VDELIADLEGVQGQVDALEPERDTPGATDVVSERLVIDRLDDLLTHLGGRPAATGARSCAGSRATSRVWCSISIADLARRPQRAARGHRRDRNRRVFGIASRRPHGPLAPRFVSIMLSLFSSNTPGPASGGLPLREVFPPLSSRCS